MKQTIAAALVLAALAAAGPKDTVKLPDADFWVTAVRPYRAAYHLRDDDSWTTGKASKAWLDVAGKSKSWQVTYALPGDRRLRQTVLTRRVAGVPTRDNVRVAVRQELLRLAAKPTRPPGPTWKLVGRYYREKLRRRLPLPTIGRW